MAEATAFEMGKLFSELTNRQVGFSLVKVAPDTKKHVYGTYNLLPENKTLVVKADLSLIGSLGGALMGLPQGVVKEGIDSKPIDPDMMDAMHEIMNIASTPVSTDKRAVLKEVFTDPKALPTEAAAIVAKPKRAATFNVTVSGGYVGGMFSILTAA